MMLSMHDTRKNRSISRIFTLICSFFLRFLLLFRVTEQLRTVRRGENVFFITEMAAFLILSLLRQNIVHFFSADGHKRPSRALSGAVADIINRDLIKEIIRNSLKRQRQNFLIALSCRKQVGNRGKELRIPFDAVDGSLIGKGQQLNQHTARSLAGVVDINQNPQRT